MFVSIVRISPRSVHVAILQCHPGYFGVLSVWRKKHWKGKWPQDLFRHTFGSNHLALSQSKEITSRVMGNSPDVLDKHYWNWRTRKKEALAYWGLTPTVVMKK